MIKTSGKWDPQEGFIYYVATTPNFLELATSFHPFVLVAVNELMSKDSEDALDQLLDKAKHVLLDSGAFAICSEHARRHKIELDDAFKVPLNELDGFDALWKQYVRLATKYQKKLWGVIEVDLGGEKQKRETRKKLHDLGLSPIPVLHTLNDSRDYYDELMDGFDRICAGNIVQSSKYVRKRIFETLDKARKGKAVQWIHLLGMAPNQSLCAYPFESCDSSSWLNTVRWSGYLEKACLRSLGLLPKNFQYELGDRSTWDRGVQMGAVGASAFMANMRQYRKAVGL
jgi:hypothetical protein